MLSKSCGYANTCIKVAKHFEMRRVATKFMSNCVIKKCRTVIHVQGQQHPILLVSYSPEVTSQSPVTFT